VRCGAACGAVGGVRRARALTRSASSKRQTTEEPLRCT
jgi:hypothetical protein